MPRARNDGPDRANRRANWLVPRRPPASRSHDTFGTRCRRVTQRIEDYALIGDCETGALIGLDGSIDWLCWPRFDSGACFAALLGGPEHGRWLIEPVEPASRVSRQYRGHTLILETRMEAADGAVTIVDFMPPRGRNSDIVRLVRGEHGHVRLRTELVL